jgi:hypothetical protein
MSSMRMPFTLSACVTELPGHLTAAGADHSSRQASAGL